MSSRVKSTALTSPVLINEVGNKLLQTGDKYYILFRLLIETGIPCVQLLRKKVSHVRNADEITYLRQKTNQLEHHSLSDELKRELALYTSAMSPDSYLFPSDTKNKPLNIVLLQTRLADISRELQVSEITVRSLHKTYQYNEYLKGGTARKRIKQILHLYNEEKIEEYFGVSLQKKDAHSLESMLTMIQKKQETLSYIIATQQDSTNPSLYQYLEILLHDTENCLKQYSEPD